jgi:DNA recombination protein RmuC
MSLSSTALLCFIVVLGLAFLGLGLFFSIKTSISTLVQLLQKDIQSTLNDQSEKSTRATLEVRESLVQKLQDQFLAQQERWERASNANRTELQEGLNRSTQALEARFRTLEAQVSGRLEKIGESVESKLNENLKEGFKHFEKVNEHLLAAEGKLAHLATVGQSISDLNQLLKLPHLRGGFGEASLERLLSDFLPIGSFETQYQLDPSSTERVDAIVRLANQVLPIDSKFPREQVLPLFESQDPAVLEDARKMLSEVIRRECKSIAKKYIRPELGTTDLALIFLPSETLYFEVVRDGKLFEEMSKLKVFPVSPNTLAIGLKSVSMAQEYYELARGVEKTIEDVKKARRHFEHFENRFEDLGKSLRKAQEAFETANSHLGHYESSVYRLVGESAPTLPSPAPSAPTNAT